jgi:hypothetical protein
MATKKTEKKETAKKPGAKTVAKAPAARKPAAKKAGKETEPPAPTYQMIAQRAYEIWEAKGRPAGTEAENWVQAERELRGQR